ncbi:LysE family translocator [Salibacterium halotolerans]|uniref:Threonine/homoserine/homoserine lactone efflux protein n=1 Tax=Salibacterium halotolerans TaxID=1884432 RepID=A0A1I5P8I0_9BACI|nr:LysE family transporter [Salibacterium halotolerans]SFP29786.1 Threonine/homoserine/homoserine lactone efflux protein [Salibacterium halotolerans]
MNITSFFIYCVISTFTPGPANIVILSTVYNSGMKKAAKFTYGATTAFGLLLFVSAFLNSVLVSILPGILIVMQILGSCYMLYLAWQIYNTRASKPSSDKTGTFLSGFVMQFLNPKLVLFTLTVVPGFILPHYTSVPAVATGVIAVTLIGFAAFVTWLLFGSIFQTFLQKYNKVVNTIMAAFLVYSAAMIWM